MIDVAYAQGAGGGAAGGGFSMLVPLLLMFGVFYFLLIRPQQKKQRRHQDMLKGLKVGDRVMTSGGIVGTIVEGGEHLVKLDIADKVRVEIGRSYIAGKIKDGKESEGGQANGQSGSQGGVGGLLGKLFGK
jgi:preprotein translocase subunit YajC